MASTYQVLSGHFTSIKDYSTSTHVFTVKEVSPMGITFSVALSFLKASLHIHRIYWASFFDAISLQRMRNAQANCVMLLHIVSSVKLPTVLSTQRGHSHWSSADSFQQTRAFIHFKVFKIRPRGEGVRETQRTFYLVINKAEGCMGFPMRLGVQTDLMSNRVSKPLAPPVGRLRFAPWDLQQKPVIACQSAPWRA